MFPSQNQEIGKAVDSEVSSSFLFQIFQEKYSTSTASEMWGGLSDSFIFH